MTMRVFRNDGVNDERSISLIPLGKKLKIRRDFRLHSDGRRRAFQLPLLFLGIHFHAYIVSLSILPEYGQPVDNGKLRCTEVYLSSASEKGSRQQHA